MQPSPIAGTGRTPAIRPFSSDSAINSAPPSPLPLLPAAHCRTVESNSGGTVAVGPSAGIGTITRPVPSVSSSSPLVFRPDRSMNVEARSPSG